MVYTPELTPWPDVYKGKLPINELFYSIQGEGRWTGTPSVFIRLQYCNLGCVWCDTRYTWDQKQIDHAKLWTPQEIAERAYVKVPLQAWRMDVPHVVFTGGEPMIHQDRIPDLIESLKSKGFAFFQIETNGTIVPKDKLLRSINWWNCSPKLSNNKLTRSKRVNESAVQTIAEDNNCDFKFVVRSEQDIEEIIETYGSLLQNSPVWLMPEGIRRDDQLRSMEKISELCMNYGFRLSSRVHTIIWDNQKGK
ncbi:7-carboxy-7-deazaguanine synthase QueE [bacterium]|nr:7-carboxy-7-deazaguanine synthase QueE [bacterium]